MKLDLTPGLNANTLNYVSCRLKDGLERRIGKRVVPFLLV